MGFSVTAYQLAATLFGSCECDSHIIVRIEFTCTRAYQGGRTDLAQRAKVGYRPCFTRPTHIAAPARYLSVEFSPERARGLFLRMEHGHWRALMRSIAVIFRKIGTGRLNRWKSVILPYLVAYSVPCMGGAPRHLLPLIMGKQRPISRA